MKNFLLIPGLLIALFSPVLVTAQDNAALLPNTPVEGTIADGDVETWRFYAVRDDIFSFMVTGDGDLDPVLTIRTNTGEVIITNDDFAYPESRDSLLEAITIPRTGNYVVEVTGYGSSVGSYTLTMLPGYAQVALDERFTSLDGWEASETLSAAVQGGLLTLEVTGLQTTGTLVETEMTPLADFYAGARVQSIEGRNGWTVGLVVRQQENGDRYLLAVNSRGQWRFTAYENGSERPVRDWATHPGITEGQTNFSLSILANGRGFDAFYNGQLLGQLSDRAITEPGQIGLVVMTPSTLGSVVTAVFDEMIVTVPLDMDGNSVFPQQIVRGTASLTAQELERRRLIPSRGRLMLTVEESFRESRNPGVDTLPLGRGAAFRNFAIGTTVTLQSAGTGVSGCGLLIRGTSNTDYMVAYLDSSGAYGVSQRNGDRFDAGIFSENSGWDSTTANDLLLVVNEDVLHYYINGKHMGMMTIQPVEGQIGNVVVNFDPVESLCRFNNTWVWQWD